MATCPHCNGEERDGCCANCGSAVKPDPLPNAHEDDREDLDHVVGQLQEGLRSLARLCEDDPELEDAAGRWTQSLLGLVDGYNGDPAALVSELPALEKRGCGMLEVSVTYLCRECLTPGKMRMLTNWESAAGSPDLAGAVTALAYLLGRRLQTPDRLAEQAARALVDLGGAEWGRADCWMEQRCAGCTDHQTHRASHLAWPAESASSPPLDSS